MEETKVKKVAIPEKRKLKVEKQKRITHYGEVVIDRKINTSYLQSPFDPQQPLTPTAIRSGSIQESLIGKNNSKDIDIIQELMLKPMQDRIYKNIYVFSDNEDDMDDIDKRYKYLNNGFKNFVKQKRKQINGKGGAEFIES